MSVGAATSGEGDAIEAVVRRADVQMDEADRAHYSSKCSMKRPELCQGEPANKATISASRARYSLSNFSGNSVHMVRIVCNRIIKEYGELLQRYRF